MIDSMAKRALIVGLVFGVWCLTSAAEQFQTSSSLRVKTDAVEVLVFLDGQQVGRTPLTLKSVSPGKHKLILIKEGYYDHMQEIALVAAQTTRFFVVMRPYEAPPPKLPVRFRAAHQHKSGVCIGVLTVNADGMDYVSDNNVHAFHLSIPELRNVSRSFGSVVYFGIPAGSAGLIQYYEAFGLGSESGPGVIPFRVDTAKGGYGFWAYEDDQSVNASNPEQKVLPVKNIDTQTRELFEVVFHLWQSDLSLRSKAKQKP